MFLTFLFVRLIHSLEQQSIQNGCGRPLNRGRATTSRNGYWLCGGKSAEGIELITELWVVPSASRGSEACTVVTQQFIHFLIKRLCGCLFRLTKLSKTKDNRTCKNEVPTRTLRIVQDHGVLLLYCSGREVGLH